MLYILDYSTSFGLTINTPLSLRIYLPVIQFLYIIKLGI